MDYWKDTNRMRNALIEMLRDEQETDVIAMMLSFYMHFKNNEITGICLQNQLYQFQR